MKPCPSMGPHSHIEIAMSYFTELCFLYCNNWVNSKLKQRENLPML